MSVSKRFRVLTICSWYPNDLKPTLGNFVQKHADTIALYNNTVSLAIFPTIEESKQRLTTNQRGELFEIVIYYPKQATGFKPFRLIKNYWAHRKAFKAGMKVVKSKIGMPEIVHLNITYPLGIWALWLKWRYNIPYVVSENSSGFHVTSDHAYPPIIMRLCKKILRNASYLLPVSENLKKNLQVLAPNADFALISNVVDEHLFEQKSAIVADKKRLIHVSTGVDEIKNLSGMIRVFSNLKQANIPVTLDIVSDGDIEYAKQLAQELQVNDCVFFHATKTTKEVAEMMQERDALLMFSNYENFPCVIAEAMMCGKPVISSNVNGIPEHVFSLNGSLVNPRDEANLLAEITAFVLGEKQFNANEIRDYAMKHFSYSEVGKQFTEIYAKVLGR